MIRLRKINLLNDVRKNRTTLYYWSLSAGFITTVISITIGYFGVSYRDKQRTKAGIQEGDSSRLIRPDGLNIKELEKAIEVFQQQKLHEQIQLENYERYKRLRNKRREQEGLN